MAQARPRPYMHVGASADSSRFLPRREARMFIERRIGQGTQAVELWRCEWENLAGRPARKVYLEKIGEEQPLIQEAQSSASEAPAICWSYGRTLGNIAVFSQNLLGQFPGAVGDDAELPCDFVDAGKFRHGAERWWCRTHQTHWGIKADHEALDRFGEMRCANHTQLMHYVVSPFTVNVEDHAEVGIWCSMPAALSSVEIRPRAPRIHVHVRQQAGAKKSIDRDFYAISLLYNDKSRLFGNKDITRVNITPPSAFEFVCSLELKREMDCINCSHCGYLHLDLGDFAHKPHRKHFCGNCGRDSTWSQAPIVSTPLKPLHDQYLDSLKYEIPNREINLDNYKHCTYTIWASTPAILWTAQRPQELGIHVHVHEDTTRIVDDTFGEVILDGKPLDRSTLIRSMIDRSTT